jgi:DNA-binding SARP family transcriptional activator/tetratricopeptide (TPR) repeat protein/DNA-binding XRE family transcriptional regulator
VSHDGGDRPDLGSLLRSYRQRRGLTQEELAGRAGLSIRGLRDLERGRSRRPHLASIHRLAEAIGLTPAELLERVGPAASEPPAWAHAGLVAGSPTVGILGPLLVMVDAQPMRPGAPMLRVLLGLLALHAPAPVPIDEIMAELWGDRPPRTARGQVHVRVGQLRRLLATDDATDPVESVPGGYRLRIALDASTFEALVTAADRALADGDHDGARARYADALRLWRGPALADLAGLRHHPVVAGLTARRVAATIAYAELVASAERAEAVRWLGALAADEPLHEGLAASLMLALAADGDRTAALAVHDTMRERLRDELGIEPGPELRSAHLRVRRVGKPAAAAGTRPVRVGLPPAVDHFVGRRHALVRLDSMLAASAGSNVVVVSGTAGVGKTTLAVRWAHQVADRFPDGQLYVDLRGPDAAEAVRRFLDPLPAHRSRVLVVLDNARDAAHVRPLLAGPPTTVTLVTSRNRLAIPGAAHVPLAPLPPAEARDLLAGFSTAARPLGRARTDAEPAAVDEIVERCAGLPLALEMVAAHAAARPELPLSAIAKDLPANGVPGWAYRGLPELPARLFRLLAVHPGPDVDRHAAASLLGEPAGEALRDLVNAHIVTEPGPGRYAVHDLLRAYARTLTPAEDVSATVRRITDHYLRSAAAAATLTGRPAPVFPAAPGAASVPFADRDQALAWLDAEYPVLVTVLAQAARSGLDGQVWPLAWLLRRYDLATTHLDLEIERNADPAGLGHLLLARSRITGLRGDSRAALGFAERALAVFREVGDRPGVAHALTGVGRHLVSAGAPEQAIEALTMAWKLHEDTADTHGRADTLDQLGRVHLLRAEPETAAGCFERVAALRRQTGDRHAEADAHHWLGDAREAMGDAPGARAAWSAALRILDDVNHEDAAGVRRKLTRRLPGTSFDDV